nr:MAG TPA: hypothetical protein [Caudoviricetes sp.]
MEEVVYSTDSLIHIILTEITLINLISGFLYLMEILM